jgi:hypothetical protein
MTNAESERWRRNPAHCLVLGMLLQGVLAAQEVLPTPLPDSPSFVRSRLVYVQGTQQNAAPTSQSDGQPAGQPVIAPASRGTGSSVQSGRVSTAPPTPQSPSPAPAVPVPDMPVETNSPSDPVSNNPFNNNSQVTGSQQTIIHQLVGTAAAEPLPITGVAASRPAGAALAPARQRRVRSVLIRVGALVGAGAAIGTTMALSQGSPSRPPGSH